jgi:hypothetical protein
MTIRISKFSDPARGGRRVEVRTFSRHTTVRWSRDLTRETTLEWWKDVGTLMDPIENHVPEQPASFAKRMLQARNDARRTT